MTNPLKSLFLQEVTKRFCAPRKLANSQSLYQLGDADARFYFRYSKRHPGNRTFFGLRKIDLQALEGQVGILCFFWDGQSDKIWYCLE